MRCVAGIENSPIQLVHGIAPSYALNHRVETPASTESASFSLPDCPPNSQGQSGIYGKRWAFTALGAAERETSGR